MLGKMRSAYNPHTVIRLLSRLFLAAGLLWPAFALASASRPIPPSGIHAIAPIPDDPGPAPAENLIPTASIFNELAAQQQRETRMRGVSAEAVSAKAEGPGVATEQSAIARGGKLFGAPTACLRFNDAGKWNGQGTYASYGRWGAFSVDDGGFYKPEHVHFEREESVGNDYSFKIAGGQPYAAGLVSPIFNVPPGATVEVRVKYLMFNHDGLQIGDRVVNDWVSLGLKPDAQGQEARYVNGYTRGQWSQLVNSIVAGESGQVLVLLQAESPAAFNSNIYFDDLEIAVDGLFLTDCE
ncbi:MAG: hypothetical protein D6790_11920 [Caldilineae bacterium]|nr:MAG: hypothetical protein D6790_11920 [Caldilineae bacterium]